MEAQRVYIKVWRLSLKTASFMSKRFIHELNSGLGELRQLLSCVVCRELLKDPYQPTRRRCNHHVCRLCLRGRKSLKPSCDQCNDCDDFKTYKENKSMAWQVLCYRTLCRHLQNSLLYAQLSGHRPSSDKSLNDRSVPRIDLPDESTQWFIQEGANYNDMCDTFLPDQLSLKDIPSLPAETPPTTAATTPELPYEQHMPEQLSITDIELEAAATGDQSHFVHPLPLMSSNARMLSHSHIAPQAQHMVIPAAQPLITAGYIEPSWTEQVDLSAAFSLPSANYTIVVPSNEMPHMGQMVQIPTELTQAPSPIPIPLESVTPSTSTAASFKRRHAELLEDDFDDDDDTPLSIRHQKAMILSSVQVKPPTVEVTNTTVIPKKATEIAKATITAPVTATATATATNIITPKATATPSPTKAQTPQTEPTPKTVATSKEPTVEVSKVTAGTKVSKVAQKAEKPTVTHHCRCGTSSAPNLKTCRNNRCACYISGFKCVDCKCQGCKNPHTYAGDETSDEEISFTEDAVEAGTPIEPAVTTAPIQTRYTLVPQENLQQSQHPLLLIRNESGQLQGFNIFIGNEPIDPAQAGALQSNDGNITIPEFAYVPPTANMQAAPAAATQTQLSPLAPPQPFKKYKPSTRLEARSTATLSTDELLGGGKRKSSAVDGLATDKAQSLFEEIMSGSDDL